MVDQARMSQALAAAVHAGGPDAALAVCRAVVAWLPMTGAAITLMTEHDGDQGPVCATDAAAARIDELQFTVGDGPCVESFTTGRAVLVADIADPTEGRWPIFTAAVVATGARGMFVFPLRVGVDVLGVLDCYRDTPGGLDDRELSGALRAADAAVWTLLADAERRTMDGESPEDWFDSAALTRAEVHQATGMLTVQGGLDSPAALATLRAAAFTQERAIREVADDVVARRLRLARDGSWHATHTHDTATDVDDPGGGAPRPQDRFDPEPEEGED